MRRQFQQPARIQQLVKNGQIDTIGGDPVRNYSVPLFYNLLLDPKEEHPMLHAPPNLWVRYPAGEVLLEHMKSLKEEPPIPAGTPDPYKPNDK